MRTKNQKTAEAVTALGHQLDLEIVAEGIENKHLADLAQEIDCDTGQDFWFDTSEFAQPPKGASPL